MEEIHFQLLLADMKGKKRETEDLHSIMSNSKDPSVRARSQKFLMDFNILQNDIQVINEYLFIQEDPVSLPKLQDEIENLTSHADKMKSYQELRDKLRQKLREMDALFGQFERDFKLTGHSNIDLKVSSEAFQDSLFWQCYLRSTCSRRI